MSSVNNSSTIVLLLSSNELQFFNIVLPIISIVGLFINIAVIAVILTDREMRQTTASIYIVNLAVSDILVLVVGVPLWIYQLVSKNSADWSCQLTFGLSYVTSVVSVITLAIISYDRYRCVMQPFNQETGKSFAVKVVSTCWLVGTVLAAPFFSGYKASHHDVTFQISAFCVYTRFFRQEFMVAKLIVIVILIILSTYFYYRLCRVARAQAALIKKDMEVMNRVSQTNNNNNSNSSDQQQTIRRQKGHKIMKATKTLGFILGAMILCWIPFLIISIIDSFDVTLFSVFTLKLLGTITYLNSILNPIIYTFMTRAFKTSITKRFFNFKRKLSQKSMTEIRSCVATNNNANTT